MNTSLITISVELVIDEFTSLVAVKAKDQVGGVRRMVVVHLGQKVLYCSCCLILSFQQCCVNKRLFLGCGLSWQVCAILVGIGRLDCGIHLLRSFIRTNGQGQKVSAHVLADMLARLWRGLMRPAQIN